MTQPTGNASIQLCKELIAIRETKLVGLKKELEVLQKVIPVIEKELESDKKRLKELEDKHQR